MDDNFDIARVFEIGKFDIMRLTCIENILRALENSVFAPCSRLPLQKQVNQVNLLRASDNPVACPLC